MTVEYKETTYLDENDIKEIIAEKFNISITDVELSFWQDPYYGTSSISAKIERKIC